MRKAQIRNIVNLLKTQDLYGSDPDRDQKIEKIAEHLVDFGVTMDPAGTIKIRDRSDLERLLSEADAAYLTYLDQQNQAGNVIKLSRSMFMADQICGTLTATTEHTNGDKVAINNREAMKREIVRLLERPLTHYDPAKHGSINEARADFLMHNDVIIADPTMIRMFTDTDISDEVDAACSSYERKDGVQLHWKVSLLIGAHLQGRLSPQCDVSFFCKDIVDIDTLIAWRSKYAVVITESDKNDIKIVGFFDDRTEAIRNIGEILKMVERSVKRAEITGSVQTESGFKILLNDGKLIECKIAEINEVLKRWH